MQHDSLGSVTLWRDLPERLAIATGRVVIAYDRLGFGRSDPHPGRLGKDLAEAEAREDVTRIIEAFNLPHFIAFGHSIGGGISITSAALHPTRCVGLITVAAQVYAEPYTLDGIKQAKRAFAEPTQHERLTKYHGDKATWVLNAWTETWLDPTFADWSLIPYLSKVRCPVLSIHGDQDEYGTLAHLQHLTRITNATPIIMAGCGHTPHRDKPDEFVEVIKQWLQPIP